MEVQKSDLRPGMIFQVITRKRGDSYPKGTVFPDLGKEYYVNSTNGSDGKIWFSHVPSPSSLGQSHGNCFEDMVKVLQDGIIILR